MIRGYFADASAAEDLLREMAEWEGTPFRLHASVKGRGCDCVATPAHIMAVVGAIAPVTLPPYRIRTLSPQWLALACERVEAAGFTHLFDNPSHDPALFGPAEAEYLAVGDLLVFANGKGLVHFGLYAGGNSFYHAKFQRTWSRSALMGTPYQHALYRVYRLRANN